MGYFTENIDAGMLIAMNEAYFGKTREVLRIEKAIHGVRMRLGGGSKYPLSDINTYIGSSKIELSKEETELKNAIADAFGFSEVILDWSSTMMPNIGTVPTSACIDLGHEKLNRSMRRKSSMKRGLKYDEDDGIVFEVALCTGVFTSDVLTDAELTAILLHEIGHNFTGAVDSCILYSCPIIAWGAMLISYMAEQLMRIELSGGNGTAKVPIFDFIMSILKSSNAGKSTINSIDIALERFVRNLPGPIPSIIAGFGGITAFLAEFLNSFLSIVNFFVLLKWPLLLLPNAALRLVKMIGKPKGYSNERFSDTFAQMYGYGPELISALNKLESEYDSTAADHVIGKIPYISTLYEFYTMPFMLVMHSLDEHPQNPARAYIIIDNLEKELKQKNTSPATRRQIEKDIEEARRMCDEYYDFEGKLDKRGGGYRVYQKIMFKLIGGDLKHNVFGTNVMDMINQQLESSNIETSSTADYFKESFNNIIL